MLRNPVSAIVGFGSRWGLNVWPLLKLFNATGRGKQSCELESLWKDADSSSICANEITKEYDLHIIVPVYNVERYLEECMDSIIGQKTRWRFLVTVVNDGSTDGSRELLGKYESMPDVEVIDQPNRGAATSRNTALKHIKGEYVMFVDSDDRLEPGAVEALMTAAKESGADCVQGSYREFRDGKTVGRRIFIDGAVDSNLPNFLWGKVLRAELFRRIHLPDGYRVVVDWVIGIIVLELAESLYATSRIVYSYRDNDAGITISSRGKLKSLDSLYLTRRMLKDCRELGLIGRQSVYEKFLGFVEMIFGRTLSIPSRQVWYSVFLEIVRLRKEFFSGMSTGNQRWQALERALVEGDYEGYFKAIVENYRGTGMLKRLFRRLGVKK